MNALVIYDSVFGNTGEVAKAIGAALGSPEEVRTVHVAEVDPHRLEGLDLLVVGSPTRQFSPTKETTQLLKQVPNSGLAGVKVAAFDTRFTVENIERVRILAFFVRIFGYAAKPIADRMVKKGGLLAAPPEGFYVDDTEGPLLEGELERAADWARQLAAAVSGS